MAYTTPKPPSYKEQIMQAWQQVKVREDVTTKALKPHAGRAGVVVTVGDPGLIRLDANATQPEVEVTAAQADILVLGG